MAAANNVQYRDPTGYEQGGQFAQSQHMAYPYVGGGSNLRREDLQPSPTAGSQSEWSSGAIPGEEQDEEMMEQQSYHSSSYPYP